LTRSADDAFFECSGCVPGMIGSLELEFLYSG
jgi:hypothetical protein